ncbi:contactin-3-like [Haliotis rufescens]|uniref:contactin-3-like n=1 Tax=Haliotis rufescens TaxID=6454 RepID=UPI00201F6C87|nr:contactin-3-like [Haliotis rufescens]
MDEQMYFSESEGTALLLNCEADGYPQPSYKWEKNGRSFVLGENMSLNNGTLVISGPTASDGGAYRCFATNMLGTSVSARFHLMVRFLGRFPNIPRAEMTAVVGEHLTLECLHPSYSSEYIQMDWEYNDKSSTAFEPFVPNTRIVQDACGSLIFRSVEEGDFPVGRVFRCLVSIGQIVSTTSTNITVNLTVVIRLGIDGSAGKLPNLIYSSANHVTAVAGHPLTMYCVYGGSLTISLT